MVYLDVSMIFFILVVSFFVLALGFWKKGGVVILIGGVLLMFCGVFTDGIVVENHFVEGSPEVITNQYDVTSRSFESAVYAGTNEIQAIGLSSSSSQLVGDSVNCAEFHIRKTGSHSAGNLLRVAVYDVSGSELYLFGTKDIATVTSSATPYEFCNTSSVRLLVSGDRVGVKYAFGDASNAVVLQNDAANPFDSTITRHETFNSGTVAWASFTGNDIQATLSLQEGGTSGGWEQEIGEFPPIVRIMIGLVGLMFMLVGIARYGPTV